MVSRETGRYASQGIVRDLNTNVQSVQRPPAAPPPSAAFGVLSHSRAVSIIRSSSLFAPAVTDDPCGDLIGLDCLIKEEEDADVGDAFGSSARAHVADNPGSASCRLDYLACAADIHRSAPDSDEQFAASMSAPISLNVNGPIDSELPEAFHGCIALDTGPLVLVLPELNDGRFELGAIDNSDVILGGLAGDPLAFYCPCCDCEGFSTRAKLARHLRAHYSMCVPETEHELDYLHKVGLAQCDHCTLWFAGITRHQETCKAGATGYRIRMNVPSVSLPITTNILEWLDDLYNQQLSNPLVLYYFKHTVAVHRSLKAYFQRCFAYVTSLRSSHRLLGYVLECIFFSMIIMWSHRHRVFRF